jgi:uncharacterized protein
MVEEPNMRVIAKALILSSALLVSNAAIAQRDVPVLRLASQDRPTVDLTVTGTAISEPDIASFSTGVETLSYKARDAIRLNAEKMQKVVNGLKAQGIADKDIQTSAISMNRQSDYLPTGKSRFKGYSVRNTVTVKLRDMTKLADMLDLLAAGGATEFDGPNFSLDDETGANIKARDKAWARANAQAQYHAQKAGYSSVRVIQVSENITTSNERVYEYAEAAVAGAAADASVSTPIAAGEITTSVTLSISYEMIK